MLSNKKVYLVRIQIVKKLQLFLKQIANSNIVSNFPPCLVRNVLIYKEGDGRTLFKYRNSKSKQTHTNWK